MWNPKIHHRVEKSTPVAHMVNQMNPVYVFPSYLPKTNFNIILPSSKWSPYPRVSYQNSERNFQALQSCSNPMLSCSHISYAAERRPITLRRCLCILIVVYVFLLFVHVFLLFVHVLLLFVHVFLTLSLPPGDNPIAVNKYIISYISINALNRTKVKITFHPMFPDFRQSIAFWKVLRLCPFVLLVTATRSWRRVWSIGGMIQAVEAEVPGWRGRRRGELSQCHVVHHKSHTDWHGIKTGMSI
jgi:hypothetical protein